MQGKQLQTKLIQWKAVCLITHNAQIAWLLPSDGELGYRSDHETNQLKMVLSTKSTSRY